jgi:CubicO group peptidase (beta-lactamase class C family)
MECIIVHSQYIWIINSTRAVHSCQTMFSTTTGLFSGVGDIFTLLHRLMFAGPTDTWINATTVTTFTTVYNTTQSSRALGWDTNSYKVKPTDSRLCGGLSSSTFTHTGYTGTQVCCDPVRKIITILLTNRCYKNDSTRSKQLILLTRRLFNDAVVHVLH